jgi:hypothetical protein
MESSPKPSKPWYQAITFLARYADLSVHFDSRANKDPEFRAWLVEERTINPETLPRDKEKKEFLRFIEDFNTGKSGRAVRRRERNYLTRTCSAR